MLHGLLIQGDFRIPDGQVILGRSSIIDAVKIKKSPRERNGAGAGYKN